MRNLETTKGTYPLSETDIQMYRDRECAQTHTARGMEPWVGSGSGLLALTLYSDFHVLPNFRPLNLWGILTQTL